MISFLYGLVNSPTFWVFFTLWFVIAILGRARRMRLMERIKDLSEKKIVFDHEETEALNFLYFRNLLEAIGKYLKIGLTFLPKLIMDKLGKAITDLLDKMKKPDRPHRIIGYLVAVILMPCYIFLDVIAVFNALDAKGLTVLPLPELFRYYEYAAAPGLLISIVVAAWVLREIRAKKSEWTEWDEVAAKEKETIWLPVTWILVVISFFSVVCTGLMRGQAVGIIPDTKFMSDFLESVYYIVIPVTFAFSVFLLGHTALHGLYWIPIPFVSGSYALLFFLYYITLGFGYFLPFTLDWLDRFLCIALDILAYFLIGPIMILQDLFVRRPVVQTSTS